MAASLRPDELQTITDLATGRVREVRREWIVRTDEQFARRVQDDEIVHHLNDNRNRNEQIREDFPAAAAVQAKHDNIARIEEQIRQQLVEDDAKLARELHSVLSHDSKKHSSKKASKNPKNIVNSTVISHKQGSSACNSAPIIISEPKPSSSKGTKGIKKTLANNHQRYSQSEESIKNKVLNSNNMEPSTSSTPGDCFEELTEIGRALGEPSNALIKEKERLLQEEKDAEIARSLDSGNEEIESRDHILAQILQEKEYERYCRNEHKNIANRHNRTNSVVVQDMYSVPKDVLRSSNGANNYSNDAQTSDNGDNGSHYMEPIHNSMMSKLAQADNKKKSKKHPKVPKLPLRSTHCEPQTFSYNRGNDYSEDPQYMEVLAGDSPPLESASQIIQSRIHRMPPETPQITGRPRLEEPITTTLMPDESIHKANGKKDKKHKAEKNNALKAKKECCIM